MRRRQSSTKTRQSRARSSPTSEADERLSDDSSLRVEDAQALRESVDELLVGYDADGHDRPYVDGMMAGCALCVAPAQVLRGLRDALDTALLQAAETPEGRNHE